MGRDELVPEFAAAAFKLQNGEISPVVKTKFGFHIVQMVNRQGEKAKTASYTN
jgi:peptidyl-prolyl cis-trans isomerase SurA